MCALRRRSARHRHYRAAKIELGGDALTRGCFVIQGLDVPDEFVLFLSNGGVVQEITCKVAWRFDDEVRAKFVAIVGRPGFVERDKLSA
jgi:hypothetical protein